MTEYFELTEERHVLGPQGQLVGDDRHLIRAGLVLLVVLTMWKFYVATITNVLWDEAHFVMSGQHLDLAYPDIPGGYPWLARLITSVAGWHIMPLRVVALLIAAGIPFAVYFMAEPAVGRRNAVWAAIIALLCPAVTNNGPIFYPEGGLQLLLPLMAGCLLRAVIDDRMKWWILAGVCGALGLLVHFRFIIAGVAVVVFLVATPIGRSLWQRPGLYVTAVMALLGLVPALIYNAVNDWPAIQFHILNRPKFEFNPTYVTSFLFTQFGIANPVFFIAMAFGAKVAVWDRRDRPESLLGWIGAGIFGFYCVQSLVNKRIMPHWPWLAFVPLLTFAPGVLSAWVDGAVTRSSRLVRTALVALGPAITVVLGVGITCMMYINSHALQMPSSLRNFSTDKSENWLLIEPDLTAAMARAQARFGATPVLVSNGHASAVHIEFPAVKGRRVYTLDDPDDQLTRFVEARHRWGLDRAALLKTQAGKGVVLVLTEPEVLYHMSDQARFYKDICGMFDEIEPYRTTILPPGRVALHMYTAKVATQVQPASAGPCALLPQLYIAKPLRGAQLKTDDKGHYFGMAVDPIGIKSVDVLVDGVVVTGTHYGFDPHAVNPLAVQAPDVLSYDPNYPKVQFEFEFPKGALKAGRHKLSLRATRSDGSSVDGELRDIFVK